MYISKKEGIVMSDLKVGDVLPDGGVVFGVDKGYWLVLANPSLWEEFAWNDWSSYCKEIWHEVPDIDTLTILYKNKSVVPSLPTTYVWSSSECNEVSSWAMNFSNGNWHNNNKSNRYLVLPIRRIKKDPPNMFSG
jgi:hypothetical protein